MKRPAPSPMSNEARNSYVIEQITRALTGLLRAKPIGEVSISELCAAAGVGRASFYRNFDSKEAVLQRQDEALLRRWQRDYDTAKARALTEGREPDNLMVSLLMFYKENRDFYTLVYRNDSRILLGTILKICGPVPEDANATAYAKPPCWTRGTAASPDPPRPRMSKSPDQTTCAYGRDVFDS